MNTLRDAMTEDVVKPLMSLQGSGLGFRTDQDSKGGYDWQTVRDCTIEAWLRGFYHVGNEFNVIAGRFYGAKAGFERKVKTFPGLSNFKIHRGKPEVSGPEAAMDYLAEWTIGGDPRKLERTRRRMADGQVIDLRIVVRVNSGMIIDAIWGKGDAKMYHAVWDEITGHSDIIPGAEDSDVGAAEAAPVASKVKRSSLFDNAPNTKPIGPDAEDQDRLVDEYLEMLANKQTREEVSEVYNKAMGEKGKTLTPESVQMISKGCGDRQKMIAEQRRR
jgi:hypothetical protein